MSTSNGYFDWRGVPIQKGSKIVYPVRAGSGTAVVEATVNDFVKNKHGILTGLRCQRHRETGWFTGVDGLCIEKPVTVTAINRVTVIR